MAQWQNRKKEGISLFLTFCLTPSVSHRLQETDYISNKGCENERMGSWEEDVTAETRPAQSLFPLNAPEIFKQDKALIAERKKGNLRKSAVMRKDKRESIRHGEILKIQKEQKHNIIFLALMSFQTCIPFFCGTQKMVHGKMKKGHHTGE